LKSVPVPRVAHYPAVVSRPPSLWLLVVPVTVAVGATTLLPNIIHGMLACAAIIIGSTFGYVALRKRAHVTGIAVSVLSDALLFERVGHATTKRLPLADIRSVRWDPSNASVLVMLRSGIRIVISEKETKGVDANLAQCLEDAVVARSEVPPIVSGLRPKALSKSGVRDVG
jgi:hypothetical protein